MNQQDIDNVRALLDLRPDVAHLSTYLKARGISENDQRRYVNYGWLLDLGNGALVKNSDTLTLKGGVYTLQMQEKLSIHIGGLTALEAMGYAHYLRIETAPVFLFGEPDTSLPKWFREHNWKCPVRFVKTSFLPLGMGLMDDCYEEIEIKVSSPERAILECLYLVPDRMDFGECFHLMEGLSSLRPNVVDDLLNECKSVKVKRRFLQLAKGARHFWFKCLNTK